MTQANLFHTTGAVTVADIRPISDDDRVSHKRLAAALGLGQHHKLRHLIERNTEEFQRYGVVPSTVDETTARGGRPGKLLWLNEGQAILAAVRSDAPHAPEVRYQVITAFMEYRRGKVGKLATQVRAHERRTSTKVDKAITLARSIDRLERIAETLIPQPVIPSLCAMVVEGRPVFVDTTDFTGLDNDIVVAIRHDGTIGLEAATSRTGNNFFGTRSALGCPFKEGATTQRNGVVVIGKVIGANLPNGAGLTPGDIAYVNGTWPKPAPKLEFKRKSYGPDIVRLIEGGKADADISAEVGVTPQAVMYWRRKLAA